MKMKTMMFDMLVQILCHCVVNSAGFMVSMLDFQSDDQRVIKVASYYQYGDQYSKPNWSEFVFVSCNQALNFRDKIIQDLSLPAVCVPTAIVL